MATARVFSAGAIVIYAPSSTVDLTQTVSENTNNYADALSTRLIGTLTQSVAENTDNYADAIASTLVGVLTVAIAEDINNFADALNSYVPSLHFTEDINNWADAIGIVGLDYAINIYDFIPAIIDKLEMFFPATLELSDDADNWADAIASYMAGAAVFNPGDNVGADLADDVQFNMGFELEIVDNLVFSDGLGNTLGINLALADDTDNYSDDLEVPGLDALVLRLSDSINFFQDQIAQEFPRVNSTQRALQTPYIRRYLNDVEVD